jgi:predicted SPOUT superfamily RNA methylase MTH1
MNERLKELAEQAITERLSIDEYIEALKKEPNDFYGFRVSELQKFAELLIRKCVMTLDEDDGATHHRELLFTHFGVEEQEKVVSKPKCSVCGTTENVKYMGGHQPYLCDSEDCIPY